MEMSKHDSAWLRQRISIREFYISRAWALELKNMMIFKTFNIFVRVWEDGLRGSWLGSVWILQFYIFALLLEIQHNSGAHVVILAHSVIAKKERHILTPFNMPLCFT